MNLDDRLRQARVRLDDTIVHSTPDVGDLDRRQRRRSFGRVVALSVAVVAIAAATIGYTMASNDTASTVAAGAAHEPDSGLAPASQPEPSDKPAYVLTKVPAGWEETTPPSVGRDHSAALAGEEFSQVYVRFETEQDPFSAHSGDLTGTIRVAVGNYDTTLHDLFAGRSTRLTISGREFDLVETDRDQVVLVPVDVSERTFVLAARGVDPEVIVAMAEPIDLSQPIPRIGDAPDGFSVIYSGPPEYTTLTDGTAVSYRNESGDQAFTITTFTDQGISCFSNAWAYADTEITRIGGDSGVIAQLDGEPGAIGTYRALWNRGRNTVIGVTANGIDRAQLIDLADHLTLDNDPFGYQSHLEFVL